MRLEALETRTDEFDERNLVLQAVLGLLSAAARMDRVLDREAPAGATGQPGVVHGEDRLLVEFVLGLVSFRDTIGRIVTDAAMPPPHRDVPRRDHGATAGEDGDGPFRGVLR